MEKKVTIKIPRELYKKLKDIIKDTGFSSVTEFIVYAMRNIASGGKLKDEDQLTEEEIRKVRERLRKLGYID
jgi:Arc/MetJ-type ribon-helix-helix transcriptional regulator